MADDVGLPPGFVLDEEQPKQAAALPPGFVLDQQREAPGSRPLPSFGQRMGDMGMAAAQGMIKGGMPGLIGGAAGEGLKQFGQGMDRAAYETGGVVTDALAPYVPPEVAGGAGYAANVATQALPTMIGGALGSATKPTQQNLAKSLMQSAVKPTLPDIQKGKAARAIETMLKEGVNPTKGGVDKLRGMADDITPQIEKAIEGSTARISKGAVADRLRQTARNASDQVNPQADVRAVENAWEQFMAHPQLSGKADMSVQRAQALKQGTYKALGDKPYGELQGASTEAQKALARGLKEEISAAVPEVAPLNARQSELINALKVTERRALMDLNKNPAGLALIAPNKAALTAFLADKSALFKSLLARSLYSGGGAAATTAGATTGAVIGAESGRSP